MNPQEFKQVTDDEWADFCILFNYHNVEFNSDTLDTIRNEDQLHIATVRYLPNNNKEYWIRIEVPKIEKYGLS